MSDQAIRDILEQLGQTQQPVAQPSKFGQILTGIGSIIKRDPDPIGTQDKLRANIQQPQIAENTRRRAELGDQLKSAQGIQELDLEDPMSERSKTAQKFVINAFKMSDGADSDIIRGMSAKEIKELGVFDVMQNFAAAKAKAAEQAESRQLRIEQHQDRQQQQVENRDLRRETKEDKDVSRISDHISKSGLESLEDKLDEVEGIMGTLKKDPKTGQPENIPGFGRVGSLAPNILRLGKAKKLQQLIKGLGNVQLKSRSGAAVTTQELQRFIGEFGSGTFESEEALLNGLTNLRRALAADKSAIFAGSPQEAVQKYNERFGANFEQQLPAQPLNQSAQPSGLPPEKQSRLEELRRKKAAGTLR